MSLAGTVALVAVDWGTSNLRAVLLDDHGRALEKRHSDKGMGCLERDAFEVALVDLLDDVLVSGRQLPVICCGMVGSRQGWQEASYGSVPCKAPSGSDAVRVSVQDPRLAVWILPGVKQVKPADVMRGEETQIAGFLAERPKFDGVLCLPGTHTKWVRISAEEIVSFQTFMTGEIFALLSEQSVLRHSVSTEVLDAPAFSEAVSDAMSRPQALAAKLFGLRAETLIADMGAEEARARLSGLLIGLELAGAKPYWLGMEVGIIGAPALSGLYQAALAAQGCPAQVYDASDLTLKGLKTAYAAIKENV